MVFFGFWVIAWDDIEFEVIQEFGLKPSIFQEVKQDNRHLLTLLCEDIPMEPSLYELQIRIDNEWYLAEFIQCTDQCRLVPVY